MDGHAHDKVTDDISIGMRACGLPTVLHNASSANHGALVCPASEANNIGRFGTETCAEAEHDLTISAAEPGLGENRYNLVPLGGNGSRQESAHAILAHAGAQSTFFTAAGLHVDNATPWWPVWEASASSNCEESVS